ALGASGKSGHTAAGWSEQTARAYASNAVSDRLARARRARMPPPVALGDDREVGRLDVAGPVTGKAVAAGAPEAAAAEVEPRVRHRADARRLRLEGGTGLPVVRDRRTGDFHVQRCHRRSVEHVQPVLRVARDDAVADIGDKLLRRAAAVAMAHIVAEAYPVVAVLEHRVPHHECGAVGGTVVPGDHAVADVERDGVGAAVARARWVAAAHARPIREDVVRYEAHRRAGTEVALLEHVADVVPEGAVPEVRDDLPVARRDDRLEAVARGPADRVREGVVIDGVVDLA